MSSIRWKSVVGWLALMVGLCSAQAQSFPSKPVTFVVPFPAGGINDVLARTVGQKLAEKWGQPVVVNNRAGAGGNIGAAAVASSPPDGHTLLFAAASVAIAPSLYADPGFKLFDTLTPVTVLGTVPFMLVVHPSVPARDAQQFIEHVRRNPGKLALGSGGNATVPHLASELLKSQLQLDFTHVPYKGGIQAINDLVGGQIQFTIDGGPHVMAQVEAGKIRPLAMTSLQRSAQFPQLPTLAESGVPGFEAGAWQMVLAPGRTPKELLSRIQRDIKSIIDSPEVSAWMRKQGVIPVASSQPEAEEFLRSEAEKWGRIVKSAGIKID